MEASFFVMELTYGIDMVISEIAKAKVRQNVYSFKVYKAKRT